MKRVLANLDALFTPRPLIGSQVDRAVEIGKAAKEFARVVMLNTPPGEDQEAVVQQILTARLAANSCITLNEKGQEAVKPVFPFGK